MTNPFKLPPLTLNDIHKSILDLRQNSSSRELHHVINKAQYQGLYHAIMSFTAEELNSYTYRFYKEDVLISESISTDNILAFAALLQKGLYHDKLHPYSRWLMDNNTFHCWEFYDAMICIEYLKDNHQKHNYDDVRDLFLRNFVNLLVFLKNDEAKEDIMNKFIQQYASEFSPFSQFFLTQIKNKTGLEAALYLDRELKDGTLERKKLTTAELEMQHLERFLNSSDIKNDSTLLSSFIHEFLYLYYHTHQEQIIEYLMKIQDHTVFILFVENLKKHNHDDFIHSFLNELSGFKENNTSRDLKFNEHTKNKIQYLLSQGYQLNNPDELTQRFSTQRYLSQTFFRYVIAYTSGIVKADLPEDIKTHWVELYSKATMPSDISDLKNLYLKQQLENDLSQGEIKAKPKV